MTSPPDKLFRDGLEHYRKAAPPNTWERIESGLDRKRNRSPWMKIAAGLILVLATSVMLFQRNQTDDAIVTVSKETTAITLNPDSAINAVTELQEIGDRRQEAVDMRESSDVSRESIVKDETSDMGRETLNVRNTVVTNSKQVSDNNRNPTSSRLQSTVSSQQLAVGSLNSSTNNQEVITLDPSTIASFNEEVQESIEPGLLSQAQITNETSVTERASDAKRTNITYSAEEVNAKYLKKESIPQATPEKKNASGLQKVVDLALDFKNEGSVLGELREKKNELLSFNIPSNKRETNK